MVLNAHFRFKELWYGSEQNDAWAGTLTWCYFDLIITIMYIYNRVNTS